MRRVRAGHRCRAAGREILSRPWEITILIEILDFRRNRGGVTRIRLQQTMVDAQEGLDRRRRGHHKPLEVKVVTAQGIARWLRWRSERGAPRKSDRSTIKGEEAHELGKGCLNRLVGKDARRIDLGIG